eukprot:Transcript_9136.p2 GENE.Transcript_9136~~Transcript_9136.p2  ORF type:complete len:151 (+),score=41.95 Transcript_9136:54-506(+)
MLPFTWLCGLALLAGAGEPHDTVESVALALFEGALPPPPPPPPPPDMNHTPSGDMPAPDLAHIPEEMLPAEGDGSPPLADGQHAPKDMLLAAAHEMRGPSRQLAGPVPSPMLVTSAMTAEPTLGSMPPPNFDAIPAGMLPPWLQPRGAGS